MGLAPPIAESRPTVSIQEHSVRLQGYRMHYWKSGQGPALLILPGLLGTADAWLPMAPRLGNLATVYAVDPFGVGRSTRVPRLDVSLSGFADRVAAFMRALGLSSADILGSSHGGSVAMMLAARHPQMVRSLVLHAPANPYSSLADPIVRFYQSAFGRWFARRIPRLPRWITALALGRMYGEGMRGRQSPHKSSSYIDSLGVPGTIPHLLAVMENWFDDMRALEAILPAIHSVKTLILWGSRDRAVSVESGRRLQRCFDGAEFFVLPGAGHLAYEENPDAFAHRAATFLLALRPERKTGPRLIHSLARPGGNLC